MSSIVITEKPSQARDVQKAVGSSYGPVLAAQGHILELQDPEEYDPSWKSWTTALLMPAEIRYPMKPERKSQSHLNAIKAALKGATLVYIACDPDREGQVIGQEILEFLKYKGRVKRVMMLAMDQKSVKDAFDGALDNSNYQGMYEAGVARQHGDQIFNLSLTRAASVTLRRTQDSQPIGIGRVKTPTMGIVCRRELEILNFRPTDYYEVGMTVAECTGRGDPRPLAETGGLDRRQDGRRGDRRFGQGLPRTGCRSRTERKRQGPPKLLDLMGAQKAASPWGWSASKTLEVLQSLYETHKLTTYPRSEAKHLPEAMIPEAEPLRAKLAAMPQFAAGAPATAEIRKGKGRMYSDKDLEGLSHFAIIPNINCPLPFDQAVARLNADEARLFDHIARTFLAGVSGDMVYDQTRILAQVDHLGDRLAFATTGRNVLDKGWRGVLSVKQDGDDAADLPKLADGEIVTAKEAALLAKVTKPPPRYTEASLLEAMENAWKFVDDTDEREKLKESKGIGRPSTRDQVVPGLVRQRLLQVAKSTVSPTEAGLALYAILRRHSPVLVDVGSTARMELRLDEVVLRKAGCDEVIKEIAAIARATIPQLEAAGRVAKVDTGSRSAAPPWKPAAKAKGVAGGPAGRTGKPPAGASRSAPGARRPATPSASAGTPGRAYFAIPFDKKDDAKDAGFKWDVDRKSWYAPGPKEEAWAQGKGFRRT